MNPSILSARIRLIQRRALRPLGRRERALQAAFEGVRTRFYRTLWERAASGVGARLDAVDGDVLRIVRKDRWTLVRRADVMLDSHLAVKVVADKPLLARLVREAGLPTPRHVAYRLSSLAAASEFMHRNGGRAVVKPASETGAGAGVTTGVCDQSSLLEASLQAATYFSSRLLVEEELAGSSFRLLYIGGCYVDAVRRDPPEVVGDGRHTIRELMEIATSKRRDAADPISLHPLRLDLDSRLRLREYGLTPSHRPEEGRGLAVKRVVNENAVAENHVVREQVHASIVRRGAELVSFLGLDLAGVDVMCSDISRPIAESDACFNEVNTLPGLHHHVLVAEPGERVPVAEMVLERLLESSAARTVPRHLA